MSSGLPTYFIVRNKVNNGVPVFDYLQVGTLVSPNETQKRLLKLVCDKVDFIYGYDNKEWTLIEMLEDNDLLYYVAQPLNKLVAMGKRTNAPVELSVQDIELINQH